MSPLKLRMLLHFHCGMPDRDFGVSYRSPAWHQALRDFLGLGLVKHSIERGWELTFNGTDYVGRVLSVPVHPQNDVVHLSIGVVAEPPPEFNCLNVQELDVLAAHHRHYEGIDAVNGDYEEAIRHRDRAKELDSVRAKRTERL